MKTPTILSALALSFCASATSAPPPCPSPVIDSETFRVENASAIIPRDRHYTQGLVFHDDYLYESVGIYGRSAFYQINPNTGAELLIHALPFYFFGEGLAFLNGSFFQLTWREQTAFVYTQGQAASGRELETSEVERMFYQGEGWGLTAFDGMLLKSDGSDRILLLDPEDLGAVSSLHVRFEDQPLGGLNELEMVEGSIFANIYAGQFMGSINPKTGCVKRVFGLANLYEWSLPNCEKCASMPSDYVANGIAYDPLQRRLYLTGKNWPYIFVFELE